MTRHWVNLVVPLNKPATRGKKAVTKGKEVAWRTSWPQACKTQHIESPLLDALDEILPAAGPSVMPQQPLFEETPVPMGLDIDVAPVGGPVSSGESPSGSSVTKG